MDAPGILVTLLGLLAGGAVSWLVIACQRAAEVAREHAAERRRVEVLERDLAIRRGALRRLADLAEGRWEGASITVRGTVRVRE